MFKPFSLLRSKAEGVTSDVEAGKQPNAQWPRIKQAPLDQAQAGVKASKGMLLSPEELGLTGMQHGTPSPQTATHLQAVPENPYLNPSLHADFSQPSPLMDKQALSTHVPDPQVFHVQGNTQSSVAANPSKYGSAAPAPLGASPSRFAQTLNEELGQWGQQVPLPRFDEPSHQAFIPLQAPVTVSTVQSHAQYVAEPIVPEPSQTRSPFGETHVVEEMTQAFPVMASPFAMPDASLTLALPHHDALTSPLTASNASPHASAEPVSPFQAALEGSFETSGFADHGAMVDNEWTQPSTLAPNTPSSWETSSDTLASSEMSLPAQNERTFVSQTPDATQRSEPWASSEMSFQDMALPSWGEASDPSVHQGFEPSLTTEGVSGFESQVSQYGFEEVATVTDSEFAAIRHEVPDELGEYRQGLTPSSLSSPFQEPASSDRLESAQGVPSSVWETSTIDEEDDFIPDPENVLTPEALHASQAILNPQAFVPEVVEALVSQPDFSEGHWETSTIDEEDDFIPDPEETFETSTLQPPSEEVKAFESNSHAEGIASQVVSPTPVAPQPIAKGSTGSLMSSLFEDISSASATQADSESKTKKPAKMLKRIGDILIEMEILNPKQLEQSLAESKALGVPLGTTLITLGWATEQQLGQALALQHGLPYVHSKEIKLEQLRSFMGLLPEQLIRSKFIIPFKRENRRLCVILSHPNDLNLLDEISQITGYRVSPYICAHSEIIRIIETFYASKQESTEEALARMEAEMTEKDSENQGHLKQESIEDEIEHADSGAVHLTNAILLRAIEMNASDIHIEQQKERLLIRVRVDGVLREMESFPKRMSDPILTRLKITSSMDIAERRRPQDGRLRMRQGGTEVDMRVNTLPCRYGEKVCLRILKANATTGGLEKLGLSVPEIERIEKMIRSPNGMVLVTGPTGSGKTTTLYSFLREIQSVEINITTVEDPVEYPLPGVNQTQISHKSGLNFALCLRAILRQDPDVVMVGEIRDHETLEVSLHAALTGHLVFSTLHTNSTVKTINRLLDMGAPCYQISTALNGILAQRLVRTICPHCREAYLPSEKELAIMKLEPNPANPIYFYRGVGCNKCEDSGYKGRVGLYEILLMSRELQEMIDASESVHKLQDMAIEQGMNTLAMDGRMKLLQGVTTFQEVTRVLGLELDIPAHIPQPDIDQTTIQVKSS
ncbi:MAG: GspE/PulE family protein [Vampirovibrionales bacterium]